MTLLVIKNGFITVVVDCCCRESQSGFPVSQRASGLDQTGLRLSRVGDKLRPWSHCYTHWDIFVTAAWRGGCVIWGPCQIHSISHCASVSPGFPLWRATKEDKRWGRGQRAERRPGEKWAAGVMRRLLSQWRKGREENTVPQCCSN